MLSFDSARSPLFGGSFVLALVLAACSTDDSLTDGVSTIKCPANWSYTSAEGCRPAERLKTETEARLGTGILGFVKQTTGVCGLCSDCSCKVQLLANVNVRVYPGDMELPPGTMFGGDPRLGPCVIDSPPIAVGTTNADGVFAISVPPGEYNVAALDPENSCDNVEPTTVSTLTISQIDFDHGID